MKILSFYICLLVLFVSVDSARADVFHLAEGGQLEGQLIERGSDGEYVVKSTLGGTVTLAKDQVADVVHQNEHQQEYEARSRALANTVAAHRAMADWCQEHQLAEQADHHLHRILELDPDDEQARVSLGYQRHQGQWLTRDEIMAARGMIFYDGSYRTAQDIALRERAKARDNTEIEWYRQIKLWRDWLDSRREERVAEAQQQIHAITDPQAATSLVKILDNERDEDLRLMWMEILGQVRHPASAGKLIDLSLDEPDRETRLQSLEYLLALDEDIDIAPYVKALASKDNELVNIAAEALGRIGNPEAISPLIDALVTRHKFLNPNAAPGDIAASFSPDGSGGAGLSAGGGPKIIQEDLENPEVRRALVTLSGDQDHGYDAIAWRRWFVNQQIQEEEFVDTRRDQ